MNKIIYLFAIIATMVMIASCEKEDFQDNNIEEQFSTSVPGSWEVKAYLNDSIIYDTFNIFTSGISGDSIVINDTIVNFWNFQVKASVDAKSNTFQTKLSTNELVNDFAIGVKIPVGKIIDSDSIYMEMQFEDDITPFGNTYQIKGHRIK